MFISQWIGKNLYSGKKFCGVCRGVGFSLKSQSVKFLVCSADDGKIGDADGFFSVSVNQIEKIADAVYLKRLRTVAPRNAALFIPGKPVYSENGVYYGLATDLQVENFFVSNLVTDGQKSLPVHTIVACNDAFIAKKPSAFPLGRTLRREITFSEKTLSCGMPVTRALLQSAAENGRLIRLTTALAPFCD